MSHSSIESCHCHINEFIRMMSYVVVKDRCGSDYQIETFESEARECLYVMITDTEVSLANLKTSFLSDNHLHSI